MSRGFFSGFGRPPMWAVIVMVAGAVLLAIGTPYVVGRHGRELPQAELDRMAAAMTAARAAEVAAQPDRVAFLGDSYAGGSKNANDAWTVMITKELGWTWAGDGVFGVGGTGYLNPGPSGQDQSFATRVDPIIAAAPDVVIVAGGLNDRGRYPARDVVAAARSDLERLQAGLPDAEIILVGPFYPGAPPTDLLEIRDQLLPVADELGIQAIDPLPWFVGDNPVHIGPDRTHPDATGHRQIADHMLEELRSRGLVT